MSFRTVATIIIGILIVLYPFIVFIGFHTLPIKWLYLLLICLFAIRAVFSSKQKNQRPISKKIFVFASLGGLAFSLSGLMFENIFFVKFYPVIISLLFFIVFATSLTQKENVIYQFAKKTSSKELPHFVVSYTKKVTISWCLFFYLMA